jgi:hypothetical protein
LCQYYKTISKILKTKGKQNFMKNKLKIIVFLIGMLFLHINNIFAQITPAQVEVGVDFSDNTGATFNNVVAFGLDPLATDGYDGLPFENALPPFSPGLEVRFVLGAVESYTDIRNAPAFPYTGVKTHNLRWQLNAGGTVLNVAYDFPTGVTAVVSTILGSSPVLTGTGTYQITNANIVTQGTLEVTYDDVGPADPGPIFSVSPSSINFGNVGLGGSATTTLTVSNPGTTNPLSINSASILGAAPEFTVVPNPPTTFPIVVAPGGSYNFDVTFAPTVGGNFSDNVRFTHNGVNPSPTDVPVAGVGQAQGGDLVFDPQTRIVFDNSQGYSTAIRLENYVGNDLKALQFKVVLDGRLLFRSIERGAAIANGTNWTFAYEIAPGPVNADGSRNDTIKVVILGNGTNQLPAGDHEIVIIEYDVINIQVNQTTTTVHFEDVKGGTGTPNPGGDANITAGPAQQITINNRVFYGDVNIDDRVDILDILLMIDYILERTTFTTEQFTRGDISPWTPGQPAPNPDLVINALDLALLQNIILTGLYPSNEPATRPIQLLNIANGMQKLNPGDDAALTFHITEQGIAVILESIVKVKGLQVNFNEVNNSTAGMQLETVIGDGYYYQDQEIMRVLVYDQQGISLEPGEYLYLNMPFSISNPRDIKIDYIVLANEENKAIEKLGIQVIYGNAPQLPVEYSLSQNYPNPFNPTTAIEFSVPKTSDVVISIYDMLGQEVRTLYTGEVQRGTYSVQWDGLNNSGSKMSSGSYIYRMIAGDFVQSKKMILMK